MLQYSCQFWVPVGYMTTSFAHTTYRKKQKKWTNQIGELQWQNKLSNPVSWYRRVCHQHKQWVFITELKKQWVNHRTKEAQKYLSMLYNAQWQGWWNNLNKHSCHIRENRPELSNYGCKSHQTEIDMAAFPKPGTICICLWGSFAPSQINKVLQHRYVNDKDVSISLKCPLKQSRRRLIYQACYIRPHAIRTFTMSAFYCLHMIRSYRSPFRKVVA